MSSPQDPHGFGKFVPGFDFLQQLAQGGQASLASWVAPTLDPQALDKRIADLKAVQFWLDQNAVALKATIQALEVQKMTMATLKSMNMPLGTVPPAAPAAPAATPAPEAPRPARKPRAAEAQPAPAANPPLPDPMQFWGALTRQFQQIAGDAMKDVATRSAGVVPAAAGGAGKSAPKTTPKTAARRRKAG
jgi:hypothetical protein